MSHGETELIDACWQRIGVQGDRSCPRLVEHVHCRNCEQHARAAQLLLDRHALQLGDAAPPPVPDAPARGAQRSALLFRVGQDWLALSAGALAEVAAPVPVHGLPHQRARMLLGVCNVRGALVPCVSLQRLLGLADEAAPNEADKPQMLILDAPGGPLVAPVSQIDGVHAIPTRLLGAPSRDSALPVSRLAAGVLQWQGRSITWLDERALIQAMVGSLK